MRAASLQLARDIEEELAQQEYTERAGKARQHHPRECICQPQPMRNQKGRDQRYRAGQHERRQHGQEERLAAGEIDAGEGIGRQRVDEKLDNQYRRRIQNAVAQVYPHPSDRQSIIVCAQRRRHRNDRIGIGEEVGPALERVGQHPQVGKDHAERERNQQHIDDDGETAPGCSQKQPVLVSLPAAGVG